MEAATAGVNFSLQHIAPSNERVNAAFICFSAGDLRRCGAPMTTKSW
jgi:hypothetical protein